MTVQAAEVQTRVILRGVEYAATALEILAVAIIVIATIAGTVSYIARFLNGRADRRTFDSYRQRIGRAMLLGLEILVAADIVRTVVLDPTLLNVAVLGILVLIRTFLSWSLVLEMEGCWPWQGTSASES
jgi:uncharacterized membrane protein